MPKISSTMIAPIMADVTPEDLMAKRWRAELVAGFFYNLTMVVTIDVFTGFFQDTFDFYYFVFFCHFKDPFKCLVTRTSYPYTQK